LASVFQAAAAKVTSSNVLNSITKEDTENYDLAAKTIGFM
jgi:hypothetical protein